MKINHEKLNEWKLLLDERKQRGIKIDEFCKEKNITIPQYYYYHKQLNKNQTLKPQVNNSNIKSLHIVNNTSQEVHIRIILPNSVQCVLPRDMSLREIKGILEIAMAC